MRIPSPRRWTWRDWTAAIVLGCAGLWFAPDAEGYVQGRVEASISLAHGRAELRGIGLMRNPRGSFDPATGLVCHSLGCVANGWRIAYVKGWNDVVRAAAARGETDAVSLRGKVTTLDAMKARFAADPGFVLPADGARVRLARWDLFAEEHGYLNIARPGEKDGDWTFVSVRDARCVPADGGSTLCLRNDEGWRVVYRTFDLELRIELQTFEDRVGEPPASCCPR